jgi:predicted nucleic acid-binding protein
VTSLVFDSTALSHFAQAGRLVELNEITSTDDCVAPSEVLDELAKAVDSYPVLGTVSAQDWLGRVELDEAAARNIAERDGIPAQGSLWLIIRAYRAKVVDRATAEGIVDDLIGSGMWLPLTNGAGLFTWAYEEGLLP